MIHAKTWKMKALLSFTCLLLALKASCCVLLQTPAFPQQLRGSVLLPVQGVVQQFKEGLLQPWVTHMCGLTSSSPAFITLLTLQFSASRAEGTCLCWFTSVIHFIFLFFFLCAWIYLWAFYFVPLIYISVFVPVPYCLDNCGFVVEPEVR